MIHYYSRRQIALAIALVSLLGAAVFGAQALAQSPGGAPNPGTPDPIRANGWRARTSGSSLTMYDSAGNAGMVCSDSGTTMPCSFDSTVTAATGFVATLAGLTLSQNGAGIIDNSAFQVAAFGTTNGTQIGTRRADGATAVAVRLGANLDYATAGAKLVSIGDNSDTSYSEKAYIDYTGLFRSLTGGDGVNYATNAAANTGFGQTQSGFPGIAQGGTFLQSWGDNSRVTSWRDGTNVMGGVFDEGTTGSLGSSSGRFRSFTESNTYLAVEESEDVIEAVINGTQEFQVTPTGIVATDRVTTPEISFSGGTTYKAVKYSASIDIGSLAANACEIATIDTADTADVDDDCFGNKPSALAALATTTTCYYSGTAIVVHVCNWSTIVVDPGTATYTCTCNED